MKRQAISNKFQSLSLGARIVWVFIFTALLSIIVFSSAFKMMTKDNERQVIPTIVSDYGYSLVKELGEPAQLENAKAITKRTGIRVYVDNKSQTFSTTENVLEHEFSNPERYKHIIHQGYDFKIAIWHGKAYMQVTRPNETITFVVSFRHSPIQIGFIFSIILLSMFAIIYLAYRSVRYFISPIQDIKQGVAKFSQGDLSYRIEKKRNDDLGELTEQINHMAGQLDSILEAKRQLLLAISHELRTPMTRMKIALDLPFNDKNKARFNDSLNEMEKLLAELLETEKLSNQTQTLSFQKTSMNELISQLVDEDYSDNKMINLSLCNDSTTVEMDAMRIRLMIKNLLGNAIKYGNDKAISISTEVNNKELLITVKDNGDGISNDNIDRVFEPFFREDESRQRQTGGTGMGLYLVKLIVEAHKGSIKLHSDKSEGTRFEIALKTA